MNGFLRLTQRLVVSDDPLVTQAAELMLMGQLDFLMTDYFNFRDLLFKGEKEAIKYWSSQDPSFLRSFMEWLEGRWAVPWLTLPTIPSASRPARARWMVACGSARISVSSAESTNGIRPRESSTCRSERAMC